MSIAQRIEDAAVAAIQNADDAFSGWSDDALERVREHAKLHAHFIIESVRLAAESDGFPRPPSRRAWGGVALRARKAGYITHAGYAMSTSPTANPTPVTQWQSLIREAA